MVLSYAADDALFLATKAAQALEEAKRSFGASSQESRLAQAAYDHFMDDYYELLGQQEGDGHWDKVCKEHPGCRGCKDYEV